MNRLMSFLVVLLLLGIAPGVAQIVEDDLAPEDLNSVPLQRLETLFEEALGVFRSADQLDSIDLFTDLIQLMGGQQAAPRLDPDRRYLMARSLFYRAEVQFNMGTALLKHAEMLAEPDRTRTLEEAHVALELAASSSGPSLASRAYYNLGNTRFLQRRYAEAAQEYRSAIRLV